jgi:hypothetical protein
VQSAVEIVDVVSKQTTKADRVAGGCLGHGTTILPKSVNAFDRTFELGIRASF